MLFIPGYLQAGINFDSENSLSLIYCAFIKLKSLFMSNITNRPPFRMWQHYSGLSLLGVIILFIVSSCSNQANQHRQQVLDDMKAYVKVHRDSLDTYMTKSWDQLDHEFSQKKAVLENDIDKMNAEMKESYNNTVREWDSVKMDYTDKMAEKSRMAHFDEVRNSLCMISPNTSSGSSAPRRLNFNELSPSQIEPEYQNFVDIVKGYKEQYTLEDWKVVNTCWKDLNHRRREIKDSISTGDAKKILKLQIDYTAIKALNRPIAESDEDL
jgi:hypothetical protein